MELKISEIWNYTGRKFKLWLSIFRKLLKQIQYKTMLFKYFIFNIYDNSDYDLYIIFFILNNYRLYINDNHTLMMIQDKSINLRFK